jgi:hypothetical protein
MSAKPPDKIGPAGRWLVFCGIPLAILAVLVVFTLRHGLEPGLSEAVGERALPYVVFFTPVVIGFACIYLYERFPKRLVIPFGISGWIIGLALLYWYFWFGPASFGHH